MPLWRDFVCASCLFNESNKTLVFSKSESSVFWLNTELFYLADAFALFVTKVFKSTSSKGSLTDLSNINLLGLPFN